jgi:hypothetical protein
VARFDMTIGVARLRVEGHRVRADDQEVNRLFAEDAEQISEVSVRRHVRP